MSKWHHKWSSVTGTRVNQNVIPLVTFITLKLSFGDSAGKSPWLLVCDDSPGDVTMKPPWDSHVIHVWKVDCEIVMTTTLWWITKWRHNEVMRWLASDRLLGTLLWGHHECCFLLRFVKAVSVWSHLETLQNAFFSKKYSFF